MGGIHFDKIHAEGHNQWEMILKFVPKDGVVYRIIEPGD